MNKLARRGVRNFESLARHRHIGHRRFSFESSHRLPDWYSRNETSFLSQSNPIVGMRVEINRKKSSYTFPLFVQIEREQCLLEDKSEKIIIRTITPMDCELNRIRSNSFCIKWAVLIINRYFFLPTVFTIKSKRVPPPRHARNRLHRKVTVSSENELSTYDFGRVSCFWSKSESLFSLNGTSCTYMDQYFRASAYNLRVTCRITSTYYTVAHRTRTFSTFSTLSLLLIIFFFFFSSSFFRQ